MVGGVIIYPLYQLLFQSHRHPQFIDLGPSLNAPKLCKPRL